MKAVDRATGSRVLRWSVPVAYAWFIWVGLGAGVNGVLLLAQLRDYGVDRTAIGLTFIVGSAGFVVAGMTAGPMIHRYGTRTAMVYAGAVYMVAGTYLATRPPFVTLVLVQFLTGYATGLVESVLNAYLADRPDATTLLNRLHAFFGVGALAGPALAAWMLTFTTWPRVLLVLAATCAPLMVAVWATYPALVAQAGSVEAMPTDAAGTRTAGSGLVSVALRRPAVLLGAGLLAVYVGLELGIGYWGYSYLIEVRSLSDLVAGYTVSGYWLGLTLGRFLLSPATARLGLTPVGLMYACLSGVAVVGALTWLAPWPGLGSVGFVLLGFFLGPIFPTTMAFAPTLVEARLVPTAIGIMNAGSVVGGSALPWLAGAIAQGIGAWTLLPIAVVLAVIQLAIWWQIVVRTSR